MTRPTEDRILAFLDGTATPEVRESVLAWVEAAPANAAEIRRAAAGFEAIGALSDALDPASAETSAGEPTGTRGSAGRRVPAWWIPAAMAASVALTVPATLGVAGGVAWAVTVRVTIRGVRAVSPRAVSGAARMAGRSLPCSDSTCQPWARKRAGTSSLKARVVGPSMVMRLSS